MKQNKASVSNILFLCVLLGTIYFPSLGSDTSLQMDYSLMIAPIGRWGLDFKNYCLAVFPVSFITFKFDMILQDMLGIDFLIINNLIIWIGCVILFHRLLSFWYNGPKKLITLLFAVWPLFTQAVSWSIGRRHLLAFLFLLLSLESFLYARKKFYVIVFYCLSVLSHSINIFFPLCLVFFDLAEKKETIIKSIYIYSKRWWHLLLAMIILASWNYIYFNNYLPTEKIPDPSWGMKLNALGKSFYLLAFPWQLSIQYSKDSITFLIGLLLASVFFYTLFKIKKDLFFVLLPLFSLSFLVVLYRVQENFVAGMYLLLPSLVFFVGLALMLERLSQILEKKLLMLIIPLICFSLFATYRENIIWSDYDRTWEREYQVLPSSCQSITGYSDSLFRHGEFEKGAAIFRQAILKKCTAQIEIQERLFLLSIIFSSDITPQEKEKILYKYHVKTIDGKLVMQYFKMEHQLPIDVDWGKSLPLDVNLSYDRFGTVCRLYQDKCPTLADQQKCSAIIERCRRSPEVLAVMKK
jgi:hypothetical protein